MLRALLFSILILFSINTNAQIYVNPGVDTSAQDVQTALKFYNDYIAGFKGKRLPDLSKYWPSEELRQRTIPDQLIYAISDYPLYSQGYSPTILYIKPTANYIHLKTQFAFADSTKNIMTMAVTNHYVGFNGKKEPYFINPISKNMKIWSNRTIRNITFYYPPYHSFDIHRADSLISNVKKLEKSWDLKPINIRYYLANSHDELQHLRGFDFALAMGNKDKPSGISDDRDNQVFCGGLGENYFHEVVHVYLNRQYPESPLKEGLAVFYGGSMGRSINWHIERVNKYLHQHPEVNLNDLEDFWYSDPYTNPGSAISGLICSLIFKTKGIAGLKRLMTYNNLQDIFEKELNVKSGNWNVYLRKIIDEESNRAEDKTLLTN